MNGNPLGHESTAANPLAAALNRRIAEMRLMLAAMKPSSTADRLQTLRQRFPDVPLAERIRALGRRD